ncbi:glycoside hydrolase family 75 protein [Streptomyces cellostaticus]|uniref:glycoside hydrolase family 75 protein n=1 Tax=Streptomyces cellostaticus TaxID=67285 RepID=UPI002026399E|nr:glycoside hydrolase family 75 protein [Streptomyces cellostaticus]
MRLRPPTLLAAFGAALPAAGALPAQASGPTPDEPSGTGPDAPPASRREGTVGAAELLAKVTSCSQISHGRYRPDEETPATVPVCGMNGAVFWKADMDVDCDGRRITGCDEDRDPRYQADTAFRQSDGGPLEAGYLPHAVVPGASSLWDYPGAGITGGGVVAVVCDGRVEYTVVGDTGPAAIIGEASYATAEALGIGPDPATGGVDSGVTYVLFKNSRVSPVESHRAAVFLGDQLARQFLQDN